MADLLEPEPDQSPLLPEFKFMTEAKRPKHYPASRYGRVIFCYNALQKSYFLFESNSSLPLLEAMCRRNQISKSVIFSLFQRLADSFKAGHKGPAPSEGKSLAYQQSMKILTLSLVCFAIYIVLLFFEIYHYPGSQVSSVGMIFGYFGLFCCALVIWGKGKKNIRCALKGQEGIFIDSYHRHEVFELINLKNKEIKGMQFILSQGGRWIELEDLES
jgi:hypothetical protein